MQTVTANDPELLTGPHIVGNQVSVAILLGVGCDAVHALYKRRFSQAWPCPVTSHSVSLLLRKSIKPTIDLTLQIPHD